MTSDAHDGDATERFRRADALFDAALDRDGGDRLAFVRDACGDDHQLRADVERLLRAHERSDGWLGRPAAGLAAPLLGGPAGPETLARLQRAVGERYAIEREIGAGGMATVFLARDRRHDRPVALKLLDPELAARLGVERFLVEIRVTAVLQHPNLLPLFDSGEADGLLYYVMPYVAGGSLRARLTDGGELPVREAVRIAIGVADALDHAHRHGVVHRDLKPENVLLHEGRPLVADFGIALAVTRAGGARLTGVGATVGTPQYMSPEQAAGDRPVDARSDVYALGCVLYEMLAGEPPHDGAGVQSVLAKVLHEAPADVRVLRPSVPEALADVVHRALAKRPADRFATARELADALETAGASAEAPAGARSDAASGVLRRRSRRVRRVRRVRRASVVGALAAVAALGWGGVAWLLRDRGGASATPSRFLVPQLGVLPFGSTATLTPDGRRLLYVDSTGDARAIYVRQLDALVARPVPGTDGAVNVFVSPDGAWLGFHTMDDKLRTVPIDGGAPTTVAGSFRYRDAAWAPDGRIVLETQSGLAWLTATGGPLHALTRIAGGRGETGHLAPLVLPDGDAVAFTIARERGGPAGPEGELAIAPLGAADGVGTYRRLGIRARYAVAVVDGWLLYAGLDAGTLHAVRLDARRGRTIGAPVLVLHDAEGNVDAATLGANGTLLYTRRRPSNRPVLVDASGARVPILGGPASTHMNPRLAPDGRRLAVQASSAQGNDVWIYDLTSGAARQLTNGGNALSPTWTPDGRRVVFLSTRSGRSGFWWIPADGSTEAERLLEGEGVFAPQVAPDGRTLVYQQPVDGTWSIWAAPLDGAAPPRPLVRERYDALLPAVSPDGRWVAYAANATGRTEVYVRPFPGPGAAVQLSAGGGTEPRWAPDGLHLVYRAAGRIVSVTLRAGPDLEVAARDTLLADTFDGDMPHANYDVAGDGRHLVVIVREAATTSAAAAVVVVNWLPELRARLDGER